MRFSTLVLVLTIFVSPVISQQTTTDSREITPEIISAISKGDAASLSNFFNENIELVIGTTNDVFSKKQATGIVTDFFKRNKVSSFTVLHKGVRENAAFMICTMKSGDTGFRIYILVRQVSNRQLIQQLRIESTND
jgi:hypothetical protein